MRYLESMEHYDYEIKYFPGAKNTVQDALSRRPDYDNTRPGKSTLLMTKLQISSAVEQHQEIMAQLASDSWFSPVLRVLKGEQLGKNPTVSEVRAWRRAEARAKRFLLEDNALRHRKTGNPYLPGEGGFIEQVLTEAHDSPFRGHFGIKKTLEAVQHRFYWPHMTSMIRR